MLCVLLNTSFYVGQREVNERGGCKKTVHEVVHVSKSWLLCSVMQAKICKQDVDEGNVLKLSPRPVKLCVCIFIVHFGKMEKIIF